jgi:hypothetical protein
MQKKDEMKFEAQRNRSVAAVNVVVRMGSWEVANALHGLRGRRTLTACRRQPLRLLHGNPNFVQQIVIFDEA